MSTLHIFAGAPRISDNSLCTPTSKESVVNKILWKKNSFTKLELHKEISLRFSQETEELTELSLPFIPSNTQNSDSIFVDKVSWDCNEKIETSGIYHDCSQMTLTACKGKNSDGYSIEKDHETQIVGETPFAEEKEEEENIEEKIRDHAVDSLRIPCSNEISEINSLQILPLEKTPENKKVSVLVVVLQNTPMKSILVKHGINTGNSINLASILVGDQSEFYVTVSFWGGHASWVSKLEDGDVIVLSNITFCTSKGRKIGRTTASTTLYNFRSPINMIFQADECALVLQKIHLLYSWLCQHHHYLYLPICRDQSAEMICDFSELDDGKLNILQATVVSFSCCIDGNSFLENEYGCFNLEDKDGLSMKLNLHRVQWNKWIGSIQQHNRPTVTITNITQRFSTESKSFQLYTNQDSDMQFLPQFATDIDFELKCYAVEYLELFDKNNQLRCHKDHTNLNAFFDISSLVYESCNHCFFPVRKGKANHNKEMKTVQYCPNCSEVFTTVLMFSKLEIGFKRVTPKRFGDTCPAVLKALATHHVSMQLFSRFLTSCVGVEALVSIEVALNEQLQFVMSKYFNIFVSKINRDDEEELSLLNENSYIIRKLTILD